MNLLRRLTLTALLSAPGFATAQSEDALDPVGEARLQVLLWEVYHSRLYAPDGRYHPDARPLRLEITYLRDIDSEALVEQTAKEWRHLGLDHPSQEEWLALLSGLWPNVSEGDVLVLNINEEGSQFSHNGETLGEIADADFGPSFLAIWVSPDTSRPELRRALLGLED
ncbi:chalcone isomerase family protein [Parahaliea aestuarii]